MFNFKNEFVLIAYYTENYSNYARNLTDSCKYNNIVDHDVEMVRDLGSWQKNINYKPHFIKRKLYQYRKPVLYVDADAIVKSHLNYFNGLDKEYDIGIHYRRGKELLTGTIYFDYNTLVQDVIDLWIKEIEKNPGVWDQINFQDVLRQKHLNTVNNVFVHDLPAKFCAFDLMIKNGEVKEKDIEIMHFQASREFNENHPLKGRMDLLGI